MEKSYQKLIQGNKIYAETKLFQDPEYFAKLSKGQTPNYLWIGCSDSRVPANEITSTHSGEIFVHRNVANMVVNTDTNLLTVLEYAVHYLKVKHIIVCGHYGCGGVATAMTNTFHGYIDNWLRNIKEVYNKNKADLEKIADTTERANRLTELNVVEQVRNLAKTAIVQQAWNERELHLHGWVYGLHNGLIKDLSVIHNSNEDIEGIFRYEFPEKGGVNDLIPQEDKQIKKETKAPELNVEKNGEQAKKKEHAHQHN